MTLKSQFPFVFKYLKNRDSWVLYLAMFVMGACGLAYEYTLSKVAGDILGNSVRQWAVIIGIMLFFMGVGADLQKYFSDRVIVDRFIFFEILLGLVGAFGPIAFIYTYGRFPLYFGLIEFLFITGIGLIIGFEIPLITRINERFISQIRVNLAAVLKMDYIGALVGAMAWIFVMPHFFDQVQGAFVLGIFNVAVAGLTLIYFRKVINNVRFLTLFWVAVAALLTVGITRSSEWRSYAEQFLYRDRIIYSETTRYQHIVLTESRSGMFSCYINGHLQFSSSDEFIYHEMLVHPAMHLARNPQRVLILGGGDGLALREVLKYPQVSQVTLCDIDPAMTELAATNPYFMRLNDSSFADARVMRMENRALIPADTTIIQKRRPAPYYDAPAEDLAEVEIINLDAARFVEQVPGFYDVIILDFPDPNASGLAKLYSFEFYMQLKKKLSADGVIIQQSTSPYHARALFLSVGRTLRAAGFSAVPLKDNVPSFGEWGWWLARHENYYGESSMKQGLNNLDTINVMTQYLTPKVLSAALTFGKDQLNSEDQRINTLANNNAFYYYLQAWQE